MRTSSRPAPTARENCGFSRSARRNHVCDARAVAEAALDHPAVEDLERVERPEPKRALRVAAALRRSGRSARAPKPGRRRRRSTAARAARARASASEARSRIPWSTSKSAVSRSVLTPFATSSRSMTPISAYCLRACCGSAAHAVEVAEHRHVLRQRNPVDGRAARTRSRRATSPCANCAHASAS